MAAQEEYVLINAAEETVKAKVLEMMKAADMCRCEKCYIDACMHTLNRLPNRYVTSKKGELLSKVNTTGIDNNVELVVAVTAALEIVKANPRH
ncbi:MAG: late competence development ComFB family protein [Oscillospiraceae bacterium]|nr:late competence development ComFB family protein [Oscillospiraceae bacterium]